MSLLAAGFWRIQEFDIDLDWAVAALVVAVLLVRAAVQVARNRDRSGMPGALATYAMGVMAALSLAMAMSLEQAWLTVALSLQIPALAATHDRLPLVGLRRVTWIVAGVVMSRLVLNYQVFDYTAGILPGFGWTLYGYGVPCLGFWYAARRFRSHGDVPLVRFLEAGALAFGVLLVSLQIRLWTAGDIGRDDLLIPRTQPPDRRMARHRLWPLSQVRRVRARCVRLGMAGSRRGCRSAVGAAPDSLRRAAVAADRGG